MATIQITGQRLNVEGNGLLLIEQPFFCDSLNEAQQLSPSPPSNTFLTGKTMEDIGCGKFITRCTFAGIDFNVRKSTLEISGDFAKNPIERADKIKDLIDKYSGEVDPTTQQVIFPQTFSSSGAGLGSSGGSGTNPMFGIRYQDLPRFQLTVRYIDNMQPKNISSVGKKMTNPNFGGVTLPTDLSPFYIVQPPSMRTLVKEIGGSKCIWEITEAIVQYDNKICPDELHANGTFSLPSF